MTTRRSEGGVPNRPAGTLDGWDRPHLASPYHHLVAHFLSIATTLPHKMAVTYLARGEQEAGALTIGELDRLAQSLAGHPQRRHATGERAIMIFEPGLELAYSFLGCLYAQLVAVPMPAPLPRRVDRYLHRGKVERNECRLKDLAGTFAA